MSGKFQKIFSNDWKIVLIALALFALTVLLFWPATGYDFINYDDDQYVSSNSIVQQGLTADGVRWAFTTVHLNWWLPLLWISFMVDTAIGGLKPFIYHLTNVILHAFNAGLLFWALYRMTKSVLCSVFVALLFAVHPLRVESVAWVSARKDVLSGFFFMLSLLAYIRYIEMPTRLRFWVLPIFMLMGLMSKPIVIILPFTFLLLDYWPLRRAFESRDESTLQCWVSLIREKALLIGLALVFTFLNLHTHYGGARLNIDVPMLDRIGLMFPNYWAYIRLIAWPVDLALVYPENDVVSWPLSIAALLALAIVTTLLYRFRRTQPYLIVGWLWFLLGLFPVIRGVRLGIAACADRFSYLPSIGLIFGITWMAACLISRWPKIRVPLVSVGFVLLVLSARQTRAVLQRWENSVTVFSNILKYTPDSTLANNNLGAYYASQGRLEEALEHLQRCLAADPGYMDAHMNLANIHVRQQRPIEAVYHYRAVLSIEPNHAKALNNLAWLLASGSGSTPEQLEEALAYARRVVGISFPPSVEALDTLAVALAANSHFEEAVRVSENAIRQARLAGNENLARKIEQRQRFYKRNRPWTP